MDWSTIAIAIGGVVLAWPVVQKFPVLAAMLKSFVDAQKPAVPVPELVPVVVPYDESATVRLRLTRIYTELVLSGHRDVAALVLQAIDTLEQSP